MPKDSRRPSHHPSGPTDTTPTPAHTQDASASSSTTSPAPSTFFLQERERLIADIAESLGEIMTNTNALNRKIEESVLVGKEIEPVAQLWGRFAAMMGSPENMTMDMAAQQQQQQQEQAQQQSASAASAADPSAASHAASTNTLAASRSDKTAQQAQTFDVAPGGGTWSAKGHAQR